MLLSEGDCESVMSDSEDEEEESRRRPMLSRGGTASMAASVEVTGRP